MQRQSLGSPGRGPLSLSTDDAVSSADASSSSPEIKPEKPLRPHSSPEKFVHLIPILLLLCFAVLYLSSRDPSPQDMAQFNGFKHPEKLIDSTDIDEIGGVRGHQFKGGEVFAIRSLQNLQEDEIQTESDNPKSSSHRKLGDF